MTDEISICKEIIDTPDDIPWVEKIKTNVDYAAIEARVTAWLAGDNVKEDSHAGRVWNKYAQQWAWI